jgi:molybdate/tungstate transport system permease protein
MSAREPFFWVAVSCSLMVMAFIVFPILRMSTAPTAADLWAAARDPEVLRSIWLSIYTSGAAALIAFVLGTPLAYLLARYNFRGKRLVESIIELPIVIPHPVVGIALLSTLGRNTWLGQKLLYLGFRIMGTVTGIILVLTFVGLPFFLKAAKEGFEGVPPRLEKVSRNLGASMFGTFVRITFPIAWRSLFVGLILCMARAISEFGAIVVVAYHPMVASVLIYERFEAFGLKYSQPVAIWLVVICLILFLILRCFTLRQSYTYD